MLYDINHHYPRAYIHRHKLTVKNRPIGFNAEGPAEVVQMVGLIERLLHRDGYDEIALMRDGAGTLHEYKMNPIYSQRPHITADNYFSGENVLDYLGVRGYGMTCTCRRDRFPKELKQYLHHEKILSTDPKARVMRFMNPIVAIKHVPAPNNDKEGKESAVEKSYTKSMISFHSTGATNIAGVYNVRSCQLYVSKKERVRKEDKRVWAIEQNEARETYLGHYYGVDSADHMIKNAQIKFTSWRYWHAPYLHALSMGVLAAYDMYNECCDGHLDSDWKIDKSRRMSYSVFRQNLSQQMIEYDPSELKYEGDEVARVNTQVNKKRKSLKSEERFRKMIKYDEGGMNMSNFQKVMETERFSHGNDLNKLALHLESIKKKSNKITCDVCGEKTYWKCLKCNIALCTTDGKRHWNGGKCALNFHNPSFWGLARCDSHLHNMKEKDWVKPKESQRKRNEDKVISLQKNM